MKQLVKLASILSVNQLKLITVFVILILMVGVTDAATSNIKIRAIGDASNRVNIYKNGLGIGYVTGGAGPQTFTFPNGGNYTIEAVAGSGFVFDKFCNAANQCVTTNPIKGDIAVTGNYLTYIGHFLKGISPPTSTISITSPQTGTIWQSGSIQTVRWDYTGNVGSTVNIDLYKGNTWIKQIKTNILIGNGGIGTSTWNMDRSRPSGNDYWLKITSDSGIIGQSGYFTISGSILTSLNAYRTIDKTTLTGSEASITVVIENDGTVRSLSLKESIPSGWGLTRISDNADQFKLNTNEWVWLTVAGNAVKTVNYKVTIPSGTTPGTYNINGDIITNGNILAVTGDNTISVTKGDILSYYRGLGQFPNIVETNDLLKAADDWRNDIIPPGFSGSITTVQLLSLADEWRNG